VAEEHKNYEKAAATFVSVLFHSATNTHFMHLQTTSFAQHKALQEYYEGIVDLTDKWAEAYQGCYDIIKTYPADFHLAKDPVAYIGKIKEFVDAIRGTLPDESQLLNIVDEIAALIDSTAYKLRFLK
jgi:DNA-binding ferritin-like protein